MSGLVASVVWLVKPEGKEREEVIGSGKDTLGRETLKPVLQEQSSGSQLRFSKRTKLVLRNEISHEITLVRARVLEKQTMYDTSR